MNQLVEDFDQPNKVKGNKQSDFDDFPDPDPIDLPNQTKSPIKPKPPKSPEKKKIKMIKLRDQERER